MVGMNRIICIVLMLGLMWGGTGCALFRNPSKSWDKATAKAEVAQNKVDANEKAQIEKGKGYVYATKLALDADPSTNRFHEVESLLNDKALVTLGNPTMEEENALRLMVSNLLSTNQQLVVKGHKELAAKDAEVIALQQQNATLQTSLDKANEKVIAVGTTNAGLAQKWATVMKIFWWCVYGVIFIIVVKVLAVVLPPPYNSIVGIIAMPIGVITKLLHSLVPEAKAVAGVVSAEYKTGTQDLVAIIQKLKETHPELRKEISDAVYAGTDSTTSAIAINKAKSDLGIVS